MMWVLVVLTAAGGTSSTQSSLTACQLQLRSIRTSDVREAYCMAPGTSDRVYFIKDGKHLVEVNHD